LACVISVTVPAGTTYSPRLNASTVVPNITILDGATLDLNNNILTVSGAFAGTGKLKGSATSGLVISTSGDAGTVYFDTSSQYNQLKTLTVNTGRQFKIG
jgi:hypothetical protein